MDRKEILKNLEEKLGVKGKYLGPPSFAYQLEKDGTVYTLDREGKLTETSPGLELELSLPLTGHTGISLVNLLAIIYAKQELLKLAFGLPENLVTETLVQKLQGSPVASREDFATIYTQEEAPGIRVDLAGETLTFNLGQASPDKAQAASQLFALVNAMALKQKYASPKQPAADNPKYALRTWLLRLGMIGPEFKEARKYLLAEIPGNGAFRRQEASHG